MEAIRNSLDGIYDLLKPLIFKITEDDPQTAHEWVVSFSRLVYHLGLEKILLDNDSNYNYPEFKMSNAAGFNKNAKIPPSFLWHLGFDRVVHGTITFDAYKGNPRPNIKRYVKTNSLVNWQKLPGEGAKMVADRIAGYGDHGVPTTINFMSTPEKEGDELLKDLESTIIETRDLPYVDRFELNISCPNTDDSLNELDIIFGVVAENIHSYQNLYFKVSPISTQQEVNDTIEIARNHKTKGVVTCNSTPKHDRRYIPESPIVDGKQVGGGSGDAVYEPSIEVQKMYHKRIKELGLTWSIIGCGGVRTTERLKERREYGAEEIQVFTPLISEGSKLLRQFREYKD